MIQNGSLAKHTDVVSDNEFVIVLVVTMFERRVTLS